MAVSNCMNKILYLLSQQKLISDHWWSHNIFTFFSFYQRVSIASYANCWYSQRRNVRLSVRHTPVLYQNEES